MSVILRPGGAASCVRDALRQEHRHLCSIAKQSPYTKDFSAMWFSGPEAYQKGWIRVAEDLSGAAIGLTCVRHRVRAPVETVLYFIAVDHEHQNLGIGTLLLRDLEQTTPRDTISLAVNPLNGDARRFYERHGYRLDCPEGASMWRMVKELSK